MPALSPPPPRRSWIRTNANDPTCLPGPSWSSLPMTNANVSRSATHQLVRSRRRADARRSRCCRAIRSSFRMKSIALRARTCPFQRISPLSPSCSPAPSRQSPVSSAVCAGKPRGGARNTRNRLGGSGPNRRREMPVPSLHQSRGSRGRTRARAEPGHAALFVCDGVGRDARPVEGKRSHRHGAAYIGCRSSASHPIPSGSAA